MLVKAYNDSCKPGGNVSSCEILNFKQYLNENFEGINPNCTVKRFVETDG